MSNPPPSIGRPASCACGFLPRSALRSQVTSNVERQLPSKLNGSIGSGRDSRSRLAALPRRCELEVSVRPSGVVRRSNLSGRLRLFATTRSGRDERRLWIRNRYTLHVGEQLKMVCCVHHLCAALIRAALELWLGLLESLV